MCVLRGNISSPRNLGKEKKKKIPKQRREEKQSVLRVRLETVRDEGARENLLRW